MSFHAGGEVREDSAVAEIINDIQISRLNPPSAALGQAQARQQRRHSNWCADAFDHRHTKLFLKPIRLDMHRTLADAHRVDHFCALLHQSFGFLHKVIHDLVMVRS